MRRVGVCVCVCERDESSASFYCFFGDIVSFRSVENHRHSTCTVYEMPKRKEGIGISAIQADQPKKTGFPPYLRRRRRLYSLLWRCFPRNRLSCKVLPTLRFRTLRSPNERRRRRNKKKQLDKKENSYARLPKIYLCSTAIHKWVHISLFMYSDIGHSIRMRFGPNTGLGMCCAVPQQLCIRSNWRFNAKCQLCVCECVSVCDSSSMCESHIFLLSLFTFVLVAGEEAKKRKTNL